MKVELLQEWMGHPRGSVVPMNDRFAANMIERGIAKEYKATMVEQPPEEKMMEAPQKEKVIKERKRI